MTAKSSFLLKKQRKRKFNGILVDIDKFLYLVTKVRSDEEGCVAIDH